MQTAKKYEDPRNAEANRRALCEDISARFRLNADETRQALEEMRRAGHVERVNQRRVRL